MKGKIKKTFLDILFEPEEETAITKKEKASSRKEVENNIVDSLNRRSDVNAKDVLYRKSAFIDLDDHRKSKDVNKEVRKDSEYEFSTQISPIFGVINSAEKKKTVTIDPEFTDHFTNKPDDSHLEIITSPIYGYGSKEDYAEKINDSLIDEEEELHELFDEDVEDEQDYFADNDFADRVYVESKDHDDDEINLFSYYGDDE